MIVAEEISVVVPAYNRANELVELLESVLAQTEVPGELLIVEDFSPERERIRQICELYRSKFHQLGITLRCVENETNLGYDHNLRKCLSLASGRWALTLGNDDVLLPNAVKEVVGFLSKNDVLVASRTFVRFDSDVKTPLGISKISDFDNVFRASNASPKLIFRSAGFIGGLVFNVDFCRKNETARYDGTLYYQIYLFALAFCGAGIGYISTPVVGGRAGNPPMFGASGNEMAVHIPGGYTAAGRGKMWAGVLSIIGDVERESGIKLTREIKRELAVRQSFHIFEMNAGAGSRANTDLAIELNRLGLFSHPLPVMLYCMNVLLGGHSVIFYAKIRKFLQAKSESAHRS